MLNQQLPRLVLAIFFLILFAHPVLPQHATERQKDEFSVVRIGSTLFSKALAERSIPHVFEVYEGGTHTNKITERMGTRVFQFFSDKLDFSNP
jgi:hypothetical protein